MLLSQQDMQQADLSFEPTLTKRAATRRVFLIAAKGAILEGIRVSKKKGLLIPSVLLVKNRPELQVGGDPVEQPITDLTREVLATRIREELNKGIALWPNYRERQR